MPNGYQITEEERDTLVYPRLECMDAQELLDVWLLPLVLEVGSILEDAYGTSHQLLPRGDQREERTLGLLQHQLMTAITELQVVQGWVACNMSSDKECRVLDGEEEDKSEGKVLKEGSEAHQPANQQADCRKQIMCRCQGCRWRRPRHE